MSLLSSKLMLELRCASQSNRSLLTGSRLLSCCHSCFWYMDHRLRY